MKVLIAADTYYPHVNGASYFAQRLAFYLQKRGNNVLVLAPSRNFKNEFYAQGTLIQGIRSIPIIVYKDFRVCVPGLIGKSVKKIISLFRPDIVHIQSHFFLCRETLRQSKKMKIPVVGTNHFMPENLIHYLHLPSFIARELQRLAWLDFKRIFKHVDVVTTPSQTAALLLKKIGIKQKVIPISCGIDLCRFKPLAEISSIKDIRQKYNIPLEKNTLLYVGRLDKEKNLDLIIQGFSRVYNTYNLHLVICGKGAEETRLKELVRSLKLENNVIFTGFVEDEDLPSLYASCDCFIIAGTAELQSIVTMEAMASGLPIIAVNAMALPELVHPGINGCLFETGDVIGVSDCIKRIFQDTRVMEEMKKASIDIIKGHDIEKTIDKYEIIYQELIQKHRE